MAGRRLRSRRFYCFGFNGNFQLSSESLCGAFADNNANTITTTLAHTNGYADTYTDKSYADAAAAPDAASSANAVTVEV